MISLSLLLSIGLSAGCGKSDLPDPPSGDTGASAGDDGSGDGDGAGDDTEEPAPELSCEETGMVTAASVAISEQVGTVARVTWTTAEPTTGQVVFGETPDYGRATPLETEAATEHEALLLGLPSNGDYHYRVLIDDGSEHCSDDGTFETRTVPPELPEISVSDYDASQSAGGFTATTLINGAGDSSSVAIFDMDGEYVWYYTPEDPAGVSTHLLARGDGEGVLFNLYTPDANADQRLFSVSWDGSEVLELTLPRVHNDLVELPDGRWATLQWEDREFEDGGETRTMLGSRIIEVDPETGDYEVIWSLFDGVTPDLSQTYEPFQEGEEAENWAHVNSLHYNEALDAYVITTLYLGAVILVDRASGEMIWQLGGPDSDYDLGEDAPVRPHNVELVGDRLVIFDDGDVDRDVCSQVLAFDLDQEALTASLAWKYETDSCLYVYFLGAAYELTNENHLVTWATAGQIDEITPDLSLVWRMRTSVGVGFGYSDRLVDLY